MQTLGLFLIWATLGLIAIALAFRRPRSAEQTQEKAEMRAAFPLPARWMIGFGLIAMFVVMPIAVVSASSDRIASGSGTYTVDASKVMREGRQVFRETCASCHTLEAAGAEGTFAPNLDTLGGVTSARVLAAIRNGGTGQNLMPKDLLQGTDATDVAAYVAKVAGAGRN